MHYWLAEESDDEHVQRYAKETKDSDANPRTAVEEGKRRAQSLRHWNLVLRDIGQVKAQLRDYNNSFEQMIPVATSMVQLLEARRSLFEAGNTTRLTYIALVFVPLSWIANLSAPGDKACKLYRNPLVTSLG